MLSCGFCEMSRNIFFKEHLWTTASRIRLRTMQERWIVCWKTDDTKSHVELAVKMFPEHNLIQCGTNDLKGDRFPTPFLQVGPKFFHSLKLGRPISTNGPPLQMITNQLKGKMILRWLYMLSGLSFRSAFVFSINSLILTGFLLTSFHLAEANLPRAIFKN